MKKTVAMVTSGMTLTLVWVLWLIGPHTEQLCFFSTEASGPAEEDCCHGDFRDDLDPGLGLLAEPRVVVTVRRASLSLDCTIASEPQLGNLTYTWRLRGDEIHSRSDGCSWLLRLLLLWTPHFEFTSTRSRTLLNPVIFKAKLKTFLFSQYFCPN